ncbi:opioid growth factor receptor-related protein [Roseomonas sp. NAR14]|uniref:Opioid growth factor receptor-related protein n=1 Tax=Roseomonas acroporae TaxID=2937791 RepID=A0A9X1YFT6_9PROT|nr:opioid growth factor receptor-related protein [Roseomonas acroporae]MCK8785431.1 opioid growth factor receptor-related protein [Roseomonas acroporae]
MDDSPLLAFLSGTGPDHAGRRLDEILARDDAWLEHRHDYIQWLFPIPTPSGPNPLAPVLTPAEAAAARARPEALANLRRSTDRMRAFYAATRHWRAPHDHNHLRITRILHCLRLLPGAEAAAAFHAGILALLGPGGAPVNRASLDFWRRAAAGG